MGRLGDVFGAPWGVLAVKIKQGGTFLEAFWDNRGIDFEMF